jgi:hypothetical protein
VAPEPEIEAAPVELVVALQEEPQANPQVGVEVVETLEARHEPARGQSGLRHDPDLAVGGDLPRREADALERGGELGEEGAALSGQLDAMRPTVEQGDAEVLLQEPHVPADRAVG